MLLFFVAAFINGAIREALWPRTSPKRQANNNGKSRPVSTSEVSSEVIEEESEEEAADEEPIEVPQEPLRFQPTPPEEVSSEVIEEEPEEEAADEEPIEVPQEPLRFQPTPPEEASSDVVEEEPPHLGHTPLAESYLQAMKEHRQQALEADVFGISPEPVQSGQAPPVEVSSEATEGEPQDQPGEVESLAVPEEPVRLGRTTLADLYAQMVREGPLTDGTFAAETEPQDEQSRMYSPVPEPEPSLDLRSLKIVDPQDVGSQESDSIDAPEDADDEPRQSIEEAS